MLFWGKPSTITMYSSRRLLFCCLSLLCMLAGAQDIRLSNDHVLDLQIDAQDRIWAGTLGGLNCFDGVENRQFTKQSGALPSNLINSLCVDNAGLRVWVALQKAGVACYDLRTGAFTYYRASDGEPSIADDDVTHIEQGPDGDIWMSTFTKGVDRLNTRTGAITHYREEDFPDFRNLSLHTFKLRGDQLVLGAWKSGLHFFSLADHTWTEFRHDPADPASLPDDAVRSLLVDSRGRLWVGTTQGLALYQDSSKDFLVFRHRDGDPQSLPDRTVFDLKEDADGNLLVALGGGLLAALDIREQGLPLSQRPFYVLPIEGLEGEPDVRKVVQDRFGNLWIATEGGGLHFRSHRAAGAGRMGLPGLSREVSGMTQIPGGYALCTTEGAVMTFSGEGNAPVYIARLSGSDHLSCLLQDGDGRWWVGSENAGLRVIEGGRAESVGLGNDANSPVRALLEDGPLIWVGTDRGLYGIDRRSRRTLHFLDRLDRLSDSQVRALYKDRDGMLWVGTYGHGVTVLTPQLTQAAVFDRNNGLPFDTVNHIAAGASGHILVATASGVAEFPNAKDAPLRTIMSRDGLTDDDICAVAEDAAGRIWMSTNSGISCYDRDEQVVNLDRREGLPDSYFHVGAVVSTSSGRLLFGSADGLGWVDPDVLGYDKEMPPAAFLQDFGPEGWTTDWRNNYFLVRFRVPDYTYRDNAEYAYRISDMDSQWIPCGKELSFNHLPYGKHTLQVQTRHYAWDWEDNAVETTLTIRPPLWWTWWARLFYLLLVVCALAVLVTWLIRRKVQGQQDRLERDLLMQSKQLGEERMAFYTSVTRDLKNPLARILEPLDKLCSDAGLPESARIQAEEALRRTRNLQGQVEQLVEYRRTDAGHRELSVRRANLSAFVLDLGRGFEHELSMIRPDIRFVSEIEPDITLWFDDEALAIILHNLLALAAKHVVKGQIAITLRREWDRIGLNVKDTGPGIPDDVQAHLFDPYYQPVDENPDSSDTVVGLALVKKLCDLHKIDISLYSRLGQGSEFWLRINPNECYPEALHPELPTKD